MGSINDAGGLTGNTAMSYLVGHPELILGFGTPGPWTGLCVCARGFRVTPVRVGNFTLNMSAGVVTLIVEFSSMMPDGSSVPISLTN